MCLLDVAQTAVHGELFQPVWYVPFVGQYALLAGRGLVASRRGYDRFFAWYQLVTLLVWALVVRRVLVGNAMADSGFNRDPFVPRTGISHSLHATHVSNTIPDSRVATSAPLA